MNPETYKMRRMGSGGWMLGLLFAPCFFWMASAAAQNIAVTIEANASPRIEFGAQKVVDALNAAGAKSWLSRGPSGHSGSTVLIGVAHQATLRELEEAKQLDWKGSEPGKEGFVITAGRLGGRVAVAGGDDSGALYGCLELAKRIQESGGLPREIHITDKPAMTLRGTCVGMQKTYILPGRKVYEYPYTPDLFPWFYDKGLWRDYLDSLVANRMNTLYLWNGHPFASLVRLKDYPYAVEVPEDIFKKNQEQYRWLAGECDKRGIWLVQMFYNIFVSKPFAQTNGISTQLSAPTPLVTDYTRKSIAEFVKEFPNVGLMVCLGEALQGTENQIAWATNAILPGVLDGMKAAGLKGQPPVVIRTHAMNPEAIMPACFTVYSNLFTETKYNGESLTTYEPRGKAAQTHRNMAKLGPHLVNVHILSNLEPFRYGATEFIRKSMLASRDQLGASGLHLYPLAYWNWPYSPDIADPPLKQWERDWIWFEAWGRYAWNPDVSAGEDRAYWVGRLADFYGCDTNAAGKILDAYNAAGEVAPMLIRRFGITEGNRQTLSLGMTLDQLVNPKRYNAISELWESQAPLGERLDVYVQKEKAGQRHVGETPVSVLADAAAFSVAAESAINAAAPAVTRNRAEFERLANDMACIETLAAFFAVKMPAASALLFQQGTTNQLNIQTAENALQSSVEAFVKLTQLTEKTYHFANSMQTGHRKIPFGGAVNGVGTNYHWSHVLPLYEKEVADFRAQVAALANSQSEAQQAIAPIRPWPAAQFKLISTNAETYNVKVGSKPFADRKYLISELAPELNGLTGIRFSHEAAKSGHYDPIEFETTEPVRVLVGYFQNERDIWLQVPNLDFASQADERGGVDVLLRNAAMIDECPSVNVHAFRYEVGRHKLELIGKGSFVVLGVVPQSVPLEKRDAKIGVK